MSVAGGGFRFAARGTAEVAGGRPAALDQPLMKRRSRRVPPRQAAPFLVRTRKGGKKPQGENPLTPSAASGWPSAKVGGALSRMSERVYSIPPAAAPRAQCLCRRASGTVPGVRFREAHPILRGAQRPRGGGKLHGFAAHARRARERPGRVLFSAAGFGEPSGFGRWVRPQPELSLQLVYPWGAAVVCGLWQGVSRGFLRGRWSPLRRTFRSFSSVRKGTRGARRNALVILAAWKAAIPV